MLNASNITVGNGVEATGDNFQVDVFDNDTFSITFTNSFLANNTVSDLSFTLSNLDWVDNPNGFITGVNSTATPGSNVNFTDDSVTVITPLFNYAPGETQTFTFDITTECFLPGTNILTERGEIAVEELSMGDIVKTADDTLETIKWIGKQTVEPNQVKNPLRGYPILIKAAALGNGLPRRDLYTSPDHAYLIEGLLINAGALVNDVSIIKTEPKETFTYYHVELENHALLVAEGTAAESYFPNKQDRTVYDNSAEYEELYPHGSNLMLWPMDYPRISSRNKVPRYIGQKLMQIAKELQHTKLLETA